MKKKKLLVKLLALVACLSCALGANAYIFEEDGIYYNIASYEDKTVIVTYRDLNYGSYSGDIVIPDYVTHDDVTYRVTQIGQSAFRWCNELTSIHISENVTHIGSYVFQGCKSLQSIVIPEEVTAINNNTFNGCTSLENVVLPAGMTGGISEKAFYGCTSMKHIDLPEGVSGIGTEAFKNCSGLEGITIPLGVANIGSKAFEGCDGLTWLEWNAVSCEHNGSMPTVNIESVTIGQHVRALPSYFVRDSKITQVHFPASVDTIRSAAFAGCTNLPYVDISNVSTIYASAFSGCTDLRSVNLSPRLTTLSGNAFQNCSSLTGITIPSDVTELNNNQFKGCTGLKWLEWKAVNCSANGSMPTENIELVIIYEGVKVLPENFAKDSKITEIIIPSTVETIGSAAFRGCLGLESVIIPGRVATLGGSAFLNCSNLRAVELSEGLTTIGGSAFSNCTSLDSIAIPKSVTSIGGSAFFNCTSLKDIVIPGNVTEIQNQTFSNCSNLLSVDLPSTVTSFGNSVFVNCTAIKYLTVRAITPPSIASNTTFDYGKLYNRVERLTVPRGAVEAYKAAAYWKNFKIFGDEYDFMVDGIYYAKTGNDTVCVTYRDTDYNTYSGEVSIPKQVTYEGVSYMVTAVGYEAFKDCPDLAKVTLSKRIQSIGFNAFENCTALARIRIPDGVTSIGANAFAGCTGLTVSVIGSNVTSIGSQAFNGCDNLVSVTSRSVTPPTLAEEGCFTCYDAATLYVPVAVVEDYSTAEYWQNFTRVEGIEINAGPGDVNGDGIIDVSDVTALISKVLGSTPQSFYDENADLNEDGVLDVSDVTAAISMVLNSDD